jgi:hypothetical protein
VVRRKWVAIRAEEIQRRENILLTRFNGVKSYVFRRKTYGERCPDCWSYTAEKIIKDHCSTCMGTGFKGGYFEPATCYINYDPSQNPVVKTYFGTFEPNQISAWTISLPEIHPEDVIIRTGNWDVYRVDALLPTELQTNTVRQIMKLTQLSRDDIENELVTRNLADFPNKYL